MGVARGAKGAEHIIGESQIATILEKASKSQDFWKQLQKVMQEGGVEAIQVSSINSMEALHTALKTDPSLKERFLRGADKLGSAVASFLDSPTGYEKYMESRRKALDGVRK